MGCAAGLSTAPLTGRELRRVAVTGRLSLAWRLGRAVISARVAKADAVLAAAAEGGGRLLFTGEPFVLPRLLHERTRDGWLKRAASSFQ